MNGPHPENRCENTVPIAGNVAVFMIAKCRRHQKTLRL